MTARIDFDSLVDEIHAVYASKYPSKCKPNPQQNEGTVIASIFLVTDANEHKILTMSSGVKCVNETDLKRDDINGRLLHDSHAEILSLRGLNLYFLKFCKQLLLNQHKEETVDKTKDDLHDFVQFDKIRKRFTWNKKTFKLGLYISHVPCGDCSLLLENAEENSNHQKWEDDHMKQYLSPENKTILRGRNNVSKIGFVRSKPGRMDSIPSFSKSCTDKLILKQGMGVNNCMTYKLFGGKEVFLDYLVLPGTDDLSVQSQIEKCFKRFPLEKPFEVVFTNSSFKHSLSQINGRSPSTSNASGIMVLDPTVNNSEYTFQALQDGVKLGYTSKLKNPLRRNCQSWLSRHEMYKVYMEIKAILEPEVPDTKQPYLAFKSSLQARCLSRDLIRSAMSPDGWIGTNEDDFTL